MSVSVPLHYIFAPVGLYLLRTNALYDLQICRTSLNEFLRLESDLGTSASTLTKSPLQMPALQLLICGFSIFEMAPLTPPTP
mmetsp:Transcript_70625/g.103514  ORF Transcript_70625/g.103514 Transcript_70625/m.103514 type:complete len:82 (+) Transcript_70625:130-375(+)